MKLANKILKPPAWANAIGLVVSFASFNFVKGKLDASYAASKHPVDYATGQTSFNGDTIKGYYQTMIESNTLDIYWQTQLIDFGFIASLFCVGLFAGTLVSRVSRNVSWGQKIGLFAGFSAMTGAMFDAVENLISFVMLSNPTGFSNWLVVPYSAAAVIKFALITLAMAGIIVSLVFALVGRLSGKERFG